MLIAITLLILAVLIIGTYNRLTISQPQSQPLDLASQTNGQQAANIRLHKSAYGRYPTEKR